MTSNVDQFIQIAVNTIDKTKNPKNNNENGSHYFKNVLKKKGKEIDKIIDKLIDTKINEFSFLENDNTELEPNEENKYKTIQEINAVFKNSQILSHGQLTKMLLNKNIYIENPKPGDWLQFTIDNVEEGLINLKDKNNQDSSKSISYLTKYKEKISRE